MAKTDYDLLSTAPPDEEPTEDPAEAREEGRKYISLIRSTIGMEPQGAKLKVRTNPHDLGAYPTVALIFDDDVPEHISYMRRLDGEGPVTWQG